MARMPRRSRDETSTIAARVAKLEWPAIGAELDARGAATTGPLLTPEECAGLAALYDTEGPFRSRIVMARHGFGSGEYKYLAYPLPDIVAGFGPDPDTAEVDRVVRDRIRSTLAETAGHTASWCSDDDSFRSRVV